MTSEETSAALVSILSNLAHPHDSEGHSTIPNGKFSNGSRSDSITLPGTDSIAKTALEQELSALATRIKVLEVRARSPGRPYSAGSPVQNRVSSTSPGDAKRESKNLHLRRQSSAKDTESNLVNDLLSARPNTPGEASPRTTQLTDEQLASVRDYVNRQDAKIKSQKEFIENLDTQLQHQRTRTAEVVNGLEHGMEDIGALKRELAKHQQANMAFQKALREIGNIVTAVANGDLSKKVLIHAKELDPEIATFKRTINIMVDQLQDFASQVTHLAKEVGTEGRLGGQASVPGVSGIWAELQDNVNYMAENLTNQVREIAVVTTAVAHGDLSRKIERPAKGEIYELQQTINTMVDQLRLFATEVTRVAQDVGTEGVLGGQAEIKGVQGMWEHLTLSVNAMANNLTSQVRDISTVTSAVANGDLTQKVSVECKGEILQLKTTINSMVDRLATFAFEVSKVAREVGTEGRLGGQAEIEGISGRWREMQQNVNTMAQNLTSQVRGISEVTQAIARGDMSRKIQVDAQGEILLLKSTINDMVERLDDWSLAVKRVARDVGVDGVLGGQAEVQGIAGRWKEITADVNTMAQNLTSQVRAFADITNAANSGDFTQEITIPASGEMDELKRKINKMVSGLRESIEKNTKAREVAELANKTKSEFLANMSHEIRTPMNGIIGMTQLTLDSELTSQQRDMLNTVSNLANSLLTIIDDVLDISKIEANRMDIERIPFSLRGTVFNALKTMAVRANDRKLNLAYEVDNTTPDFVVGDSFRLRQIIVNLVGNALKFTEIGQIKVSLSRAPASGEDNDPQSPDAYAVLFAVQDTGIGIPQDKLNVIFETFQQADGSTTRKFGGTGLGLSISKKLVNLMGGNLWVESACGKGSTFYFTCRFGQPDTSVDVIKPSLHPYRKHTVLFIDQGNTGCAELIVESLKKLDLIPLTIRDGDEQAPPAIPSANGHAYDCVIVDSIETARRLRQMDKFKYIPIVMLSPQVSVSFKKTLEDGIASYMTTPCLPIDLGNALIPALEGRATPSKSSHSRSFDILLAEDNTVNQKLAVKILEKYNHTVTVANNGLEAFDAVKAKMYDVVLMDVQMPVMGGFEATETIREWESIHRTKRTPIIALTAHAMLGDRDKCLQAQMDDYLSKPLKQSHLIQTILKYATMNDALLEHKTKSRRSLILEAAQHTRDTTNHTLPTNLSSQNLKDLDTTNAATSSEPSSTSSSPPQATGGADDSKKAKPTLSSGANLVPPRRPLLANRGMTDNPKGLDSPSIFASEQEDPMDKVLWRSNSNF